jgi:hypothetical protein
LLFRLYVNDSVAKESKSLIQKDFLLKMPAFVRAFSCLFFSAAFFPAFTPRIQPILSAGLGHGTTLAMIAA